MKDYSDENVPLHKLGSWKLREVGAHNRINRVFMLELPYSPVQRLAERDDITSMQFPHVVSNDCNVPSCKERHDPLQPDLLLVNVQIQTRLSIWN